MQVSNEVKQAYQSNSVHKNLIVTFPELDLTVDKKNIYYESMNLKESLVESQSIEFVGCISSSFNIQLNGINERLKGKKIEVSISTDDTEPIPLFHGTVYSAVAQTNKNYKKITAYDELYDKGNVEVSKWYNSLTFPVTLKTVRDSLFEYIGLTQAEISLPNDNIQIKKQYDPKTLKSLDVIKAICQINGALGIINRNGDFEYRILAQNIYNIPYPGTTLFPGATTFPATPEVIALAKARKAADSINAENFSFYKTVDYEDYEVKPVDKITIRESEDDTGVSYGNGKNNYIIQGNIFAYGLPNDTLKTIASNIYRNVKGFSYIPFKSDNNGLPFLECGEAVSYMAIDWQNSTSGNVVHVQKSFYVLNREMSGIQALRDKYSAEGEEYQTEFITDLQTQIDTLKKKQKSEVTKTDLEDTKEEIMDYVDNSIASIGGGANIIEVDVIPSNYETNTLYVVPGMVIVE